ncbi:glycoside hydrolase family 18 protein [Aeromonas veronii]
MSQYIFLLSIFDSNVELKVMLRKSNVFTKKMACCIPIFTSTLLFSISAIATDVELVNGIPAEKLAQFVFPGSSLNESLDMFRDEYYYNPSKLDRLLINFNGYQRDLAERDNVSLELLSDGQRQDIEDRPYIINRYLTPKAPSISRTKYSAVPLFWDSVPAKDKGVTGIVMGKVDADSLMEQGVDFDLDNITSTSLDVLVIGDFGVCSITPSIKTQCSKDGLSQFEIAPISRENMLRIAKNSRQKMKLLPALTGRIKPASARGLYEAAFYYKEKVNPNAKILLSLSADLEKLAVGSSDFINYLSHYIQNWKYDGVVFDSPEFNGGKIDIALNLIEGLRRNENMRGKTIGFHLLGSHHLDDWDKDAIQQLVNKVDFINVDINRSFDKHEILHSTPYIEQSNHKSPYVRSYEGVIDRLMNYGLPANKFITNIETVWRVNYYDEIVSRPANPGRIFKATPDGTKDDPGTFELGSYYFYDIDTTIDTWKKMNGPDSISDYYEKQQEKLVTSGNYRELVTDKVVYGRTYGILGAHVRLDQDNGKIVSGVVDGLNLQADKNLTFSGADIIIKDDRQYMRMTSHSKCMIVDSANGIKSNATTPVWYNNVDYTDISVPIQDENGKKYEYKLRATTKRANMVDFSINNCVTAVESHSDHINDMYRAGYQGDTYIRALSDNDNLPTGHRYTSINPAIFKVRGWHDQYNYGNISRDFRRIFLHVDIIK